MADEQLEQCPCCKGRARIIIPAGRYFTFYAAACTKCGLQTQFFKNKADAVKAWNRRNDGWISVMDRFPENDDYILVSFSNFPLPDIARYEEDEDGNGAFYPGDDDKTCGQYGLFVNAWMPLPEQYKEEEDE